MNEFKVGDIIYWFDLEQFNQDCVDIRLLGISSSAIDYVIDNFYITFSGDKVYKNCAYGYKGAAIEAVKAILDEIDYV